MFNRFGNGKLTQKCLLNISYPICLPFWQVPSHHRVSSGALCNCTDEHRRQRAAGMIGMIRRNTITSLKCTLYFSHMHTSICTFHVVGSFCSTSPKSCYEIDDSFENQLCFEIREIWHYSTFNNQIYSNRYDKTNVM